MHIATIAVSGLTTRSWIYSRRVFVAGLLFIICLVHQESFAQQGPTFDNRGKIVDMGNLAIDYYDGETEDTRWLVDYLFKSKGAFFSQFISNFNNSINLAQDIQVTFAPWSMVHGRPDYDDYIPNSKYIPEKNLVFISYGSILEIRDAFAKNHDFIKNDYVNEFDVKVFPNIVNMLLHELGHAIIDVNNLAPGIDRHTAEQLADEIAYLLMSVIYSSKGQDIYDLAQVAMLYFHRNDENSLNMADERQDTGEHPDDADRADAYMCWMYGEHPSVFKDFLENVTEWNDCKYQFESLEAKWENPLAPMWKGD